MKNCFDKGRCKEQRIYYLIMFIIIFLIEVLIALYVHDDFIRPYVGDVLVVFLIYCFIRIFIPTGIRLMTLYVFIFASSIEVLQYFRIVKMLGLEKNDFFRILIGSVFDIKDIACYGVGCLLIRIYEMVRLKT